MGLRHRRYLSSRDRKTRTISQIEVACDGTSLSCVTWETFMNMFRRMKKDQELQVAQLRAALGAIAVSEPAVFWVYVDDADRWCVRREGTPGERKFDSRKM